MRIARRLFVVPLANDRHGKSTMIRGLVSQGLGENVALQKKGKRSLTSPWGRPIDAYIFGRSYQEKEKAKYGTVENTLRANDSEWHKRELIIMPSHVAAYDHPDIEEMIVAGHRAGFDMIAASVILFGPNGDNRAAFPDIWEMNWDERWTIPNPHIAKPEGQLEALGRDLWTWICQALAS
ncbi:hypothetical protein PVA19_11250 [Agrobacterium sp. CNPSo 3708]|uniref:hypothetical protein n=1 Tax=Agrobacterium sp. CNPSo 3708 TaxID=3028150 RepID=UPI0023639B90|nr:hypothetical protein [Agrobacterium sp. CNPSo 3708]MDD1498988.1 hypothetical protein [Agrobacterium sp. CNPSo 3708]